MAIKRAKSVSKVAPKTTLADKFKKKVEPKPEPEVKVEVAEEPEVKVEVAEEPEVKVEVVPEPEPGPALPKFIVIHKRVERMWNPGQKIYITPHTPVELKVDNWVECQLKAGLITEV